MNFEVISPVEWRAGTQTPLQTSALNFAGEYVAASILDAPAAIGNAGSSVLVVDTENPAALKCDAQCNTG
jgi:hypothetical protein